MTEPASARLGDERWSELVRKLEGGGGESGFADALLVQVKDRFALLGAALYVASDRGLRREAQVGEGRFPLTLGEPDAEGIAQVPLPGAALAYVAGDAGHPELPVDLAMGLAASARLLRQGRRLKRQSFEVNYRGVELEALYDVGLAIASTLNLEELCEEVLLRAVSLLDARRGALYLAEGDAYHLHRTIGGYAPDEVERDDPRVHRLLAGEEIEAAELLPEASFLLAVPVGDAEEAQGLLLVADKESRRGIGPFPTLDKRTLHLFANQAAIAIKNAHLHRQALDQERLVRELELAAEIQQRLLPKSAPEIPGLEILGWTRPARHVGGDYYDFLRLDGDRLGVVVADASGKGMPAALMVSTLYSGLRLLSDRRAPIAELLDRLNRHIAGASGPSKFITALLVAFEPGGEQLEAVNAGHNPALLVSADGTLRELTADGLPLGLFRESCYRSQRLSIASGDLLCLYSDGITECSSPAEEEFGVERLAKILRRRRDEPLADIIAAIDAEMRHFGAGSPQGDDQTVLLARRGAG